ncbi:MAG TPA: response regulator [Bacteroidota bacterium]|jgi:two-component system chemotaxis response regulator CheY|nr:response regulator [Bacteroidota bacterium]
MANVLVVDDSIMIRKLIKTILENENHKVIAEASDGEEAYNMYTKFNPDLVTMDVSMPNVNGILAVKKIINNYPEANIIMVSAISQRDMVFEALESGAKHYIIKPITREKIISVINEVLCPIE